jgi:glucosylceramidase
VTRNPAYYIIAHASKFVRPGSVRVASTSPDPLPNVAFQTPAGRVVAVVLNREPGPRTFNLRQGDQVVRASLPGGAVATLVW